MSLRRGPLPHRALALVRVFPRIAPSVAFRTGAAAYLNVPCRAFTTSQSLHKRTHHVPLGPPAPEFDPEERVTFTEVMTRRRFLGRLVAATAAGMPSSAFKRPSMSQDRKHIAMNWNERFTLECLSRKPCTLKTAAREHLGKKDLISLGGGLPSVDYFPLEQLNMFVHMEPFFGHLAGSPFKRTDPKSLGIPGGTLKKGKYRYKPGQLEEGLEGIRQVSVSPCIRKRFAEKAQTKNGQEYDLTIAQNYAQASGPPQMLRFVTEQTEVVHDPPYKDWACAMTPGSTAGLEQILRMLCERESSLVTDEYIFSTALETARPLGINVVGVPIDHEGIIPEKLDQKLSNWAEAEGEKPRVMYTIPTGHNPTGTTMSRERRQAIYKVAQKHNLVIIEDDPYYFLQFTKEDLILAGGINQLGGPYIDMLQTAKEGREEPEPEPEPEFELKEEEEEEGEEEGEGEDAEFSHRPEDYGYNSYPTVYTAKTRPKIGDPDFDYFKGKKQKGRISVAESVLYAGRQATAAKRTTVACPAAPEDYYVRNLIPSFVSLDTDGRVIRLDTFSKTLMPGLRLGWVTAPEHVIQKFIQHSEVCSQGPSGISQLIAWKLIDAAGEGWGHDGFINWVEGLSNQYQGRRNIMLAACNRYFDFDHKGFKLEGAGGTMGLVTWSMPQGGMFLWITIDHTKHQDYPKKSILEIEDDIFKLCTKTNVLLAKGSWFIAEEGKEPSKLCFRATYASANKEEMGTAISRFAKAVQNAFKTPGSATFEMEMGLMKAMQEKEKVDSGRRRDQEFL